MDMMSGMGPWMMLLSVLIALVVLGGAVAGIIWVIQQLTERSSRKQVDREPWSETPEQILRRRYATGEIDKDEYHRKQRDIGGGR